MNFNVSAHREANARALWRGRLASVGPLQVWQGTRPDGPVFIGLLCSFKQFFSEGCLPAQPMQDGDQTRVEKLA